MTLIFVTGISGAGKSTVREELKRRGFAAFDTDEDGIAQWRHTVTGSNTRLATRTDHNFGTKPHELELILRWREGVDDHYARRGAIIVDATPPPGRVVDKILQAFEEAK